VDLFIALNSEGLGNITFGKLAFLLFPDERMETPSLLDNLEKQTSITDIVSMGPNRVAISLTPPEDRTI
jgi:hypothetical protein